MTSAAVIKKKIRVTNAKARRNIKALTVLPIIGKNLQVQLLNKPHVIKITISTCALSSHHVDRSTRGTFIHGGVLRPVSIAMSWSPFAPISRNLFWKKYKKIFYFSFVFFNYLFFCKTLFFSKGTFSNAMLLLFVVVLEIYFVCFFWYKIRLRLDFTCWLYFF